MTEPQESFIDQLAIAYSLSPFVIIRDFATLKANAEKLKELVNNSQTDVKKIDTLTDDVHYLIDHRSQTLDRDYSKTLTKYFTSLVKGTLAKI